MSNPETRKTSISFVSGVFRTGAKHLAALGYTRRSPGIFTIELAPNTLGWVGLNKSIRGGGLRINPVIGVRHQHLESIVSTLQGIPNRSFIPPSISSPLGYLMPQDTFVQWEFSADSDNEPTLREMAADIQMYGRPFMLRHCEVATLLESAQNRWENHPEQQDYRIIVALALMGKRERAQCYIEELLQKLSSRMDPAAGHFRKFVERFNAYDFQR